MKASFSPTILIIGLFALMMSFFLTSCRPSPHLYRGDGVSKTIVVDTNITYPKALTGPRYGCPGNRLANDQILGYQDENISVKQTCPCELSDQELNNQNYYFGNRNSGGSWFDWSGNDRWILDVLKAILVFIMLILGLALIFWLLDFITGLLARRNHHAKSNTDTTNNVPPVAPQGTWVRAGDALVPAGMMLLPANGMYIPPKTTGEGRDISIKEYPVEPVDWVAKKPATPSA